MQEKQVIEKVVDDLKVLQLSFPVQITNRQQLHQHLADTINYLITNDFSWLISILYRLDISEKKLKKLLNQAGDVPAGSVIADLIIERQLQKIETRQAFKTNTEDTPDEEKW